MYRLEKKEFVKQPYVSFWALLGFQAGYINAFGFLACGRYVSHITGFGTQIGVVLGHGQVLLALELLGFPLFFILGSFCSALFTIVRIERGLKPKFDLVTFFIPVILSALLILGYLGFFGKFEEKAIQLEELGLLFLLSFVCGMQNGCFAVLTKGQIRTTHLTGISTDIGTDLARIWFGNLKHLEHKLTKDINFSRFATFGFFAAGSIFSVLVSHKFGYGALVVPILSSSVSCAVIYFIDKK